MPSKLFGTCIHFSLLFKFQGRSIQDCRQTSTSAARLKPDAFASKGLRNNPCNLVWPAPVCHLVRVSWALHWGIIILFHKVGQLVERAREHLAGRRELLHLLLVCMARLQILGSHLLLKFNVQRSTLAAKEVNFCLSDWSLLFFWGELTSHVQAWRKGKCTSRYYLLDIQDQHIFLAGRVSCCLKTSLATPNAHCGHVYLIAKHEAIQIFKLQGVTFGTPVIIGTCYFRHGWHSGIRSCWSPKAGCTIGKSNSVAWKYRRGLHNGRASYTSCQRCTSPSIFHLECSDPRLGGQDDERAMPGFGRSYCNDHSCDHHRAYEGQSGDLG